MKYFDGYKVLACHYDSKTTPAGFLGAVDSAVPCAQLLHIADKLKDELRKSPNVISVNQYSNHFYRQMILTYIQCSKTTLQLIFFDGEEAIRQWSGNDNTYGSRHLAEKSSLN